MVGLAVCLGMRLSVGREVDELLWWKGVERRFMAYTKIEQTWRVRVV